MVDEKFDKKSLSLILSWIFGVIFLLGGFSGLVSAEFIPALAMFVMGLVLIPPFGKFVNKKWGYNLNALKKAVVVIIGFLIFGFTISPSESSKSQTQIKQQKQVTETKKDDVQEFIVETPTAQPETVPDAQLASEKKSYPVVKVVDGDTVQVNIDGKNEVLRLIGINTPETVDPRKPVECFGAEASAKSKEVLTGKQVSLEADETQSERDKYGRLLRYVYLEDGTNFNKMMIENGYAYEYTYGTPYKYQADFKDAQEKAKNEKKGLWAEDTCNGESVKTIISTVTQTNQTATKNEVPTPNSGSLTCAGKTKCGQMSSCQEAKFYLNNCGVSKLDADKDGIPCETICN